MPIIEKDVLRPGRYTLRNGHVYTVTAQHVRESLANGTRTLNNEMSCPLIWEHDLDAVPMPRTELLSALQARGDESVREWSAGFAKNAFGHVTGLKLKTENGQPVLYSVNEIPDAKDAERWKRCRFVSPRIDHDFFGTDGAFYPGACITHLAATPQPVQTKQFPVMLSAGTAGLQRGRGRTTVFLSAEKGSIMADEKDGKVEEAGEGADITRLKNALAAMNPPLVIPDGVTDLAGICLAIETLAANSEGGGVDDNYDPESGSVDSTSTPSGPMMMSQAAVKAEGRLKEAERKALVRRINRIRSLGMPNGLIDQPQINKLLRSVAGASLSFDAQGALKRTDIVVEIEACERMLNNLARGGRLKDAAGGKVDAGINLSDTTVVTIPEPSGDGDEDEKKKGVRAAVDAAKKRMGIREPAAAK